MVFLWPQNLKPDPRDNANVLLVYTNKGLFNHLGRMWVCWGNLRTEHMRQADLRTQLGRQAGLTRGLAEGAQIGAGPAVSRP